MKIGKSFDLIREEENHEEEVQNEFITKYFELLFVLMELRFLFVRRRVRREGTGS